MARYLEGGKVPTPRNSVEFGSTTVYAWTDEEIERVRKILPKIANGRKTRYKKKGPSKKK